MNYKSTILPSEAQDAITQMNELGKQGTPFLFVIDYEMKKPIVVPLSDLDQHEIYFKINELSHLPVPATVIEKKVSFEKHPISFEEYAASFRIVKDHLQRGNSFLINLTKPTPITLNLSLSEIFERSQAKYQLLFKDEFVLFSPETFVRIQDGIISSHPMKGTIDATLPNAEANILANKKELAEHATIVDLIRNDISMVAEKVWVERFRYIDRLRTNEGELLQVSSEICGQLPPHYQEQIGSILFKLLPAGSITGAPKPQTLAIIAEAEQYERGYYTGIFGVFDGQNLDSGVMIRFIEKNEAGQLIFKSGGGITVFADVSSEYQELIDKVYLSV